MMPPDELPLVRFTVLRTVAPLLKVIKPVGGDPSPEALTVAVSNKAWGVCWEASAVFVATWVMTKLVGVEFTLELKLLSPLYPAVMEWVPELICEFGGDSALPILSTVALAIALPPSQKFTYVLGAPYPDSQLTCA